MTDVHVAVFHADAPVKRSWVYLKQGDKTTLLRSDDEGQIKQHRQLEQIAEIVRGLAVGELGGRLRRGGDG